MVSTIRANRSGVLPERTWCPVFCVPAETPAWQTRTPLFKSTFPAAISNATIVPHVSCIFAGLHHNCVRRFSLFFRSAIIQQYSLNLQTEASEGWLLEVGYVGTHGSHLVRQRSLNQALSASAENPIRGVSTNTVANIALRLPVLGIPPDSGVEMESEVARRTTVLK